MLNNKIFERSKHFWTKHGFDNVPVFVWVVLGGVFLLVALVDLGVIPDYSLPSEGGGLYGVLIILGIYLLPSVVAWNRKHNNRAAIITLNILLGWTVIGWAGALVWAMTKDVEARP